MIGPCGHTYGTYDFSNGQTKWQAFTQFDDTVNYYIESDNLKTVSKDDLTCKDCVMAVDYVGRIWYKNGENIETYDHQTKLNFKFKSTSRKNKPIQ